MRAPSRAGDAPPSYAPGAPLRPGEAPPGYAPGAPSRAGEAPPGYAPDYRKLATQGRRQLRTQLNKQNHAPFLYQSYLRVDKIIFQI